MSTEKSNPGLQRKWMAGEEKTPNRWIFLLPISLLLFIAVGVFVWAIMDRDKPDVFVSSLAVGAYNDAAGFADPAYANWRLLEGLEEFCTDRGIEPWKLLKNTAGPGELLNDASQIERVARAINSESGKQCTTSDTLVVFLRGHSLVETTDDPERPCGKAWFLAGEYSGTTAGDLKRESSSAIALDKLIGMIGQSTPGNIVILADICDLSAVPQMGIMVNPVSSAIESICANADKTSGKNIWIITANSSLQPVYSSDLRRKTLLQSGAEYAFRHELHENGKDQATTTLDEFYDALLRYCDKATDGAQTPLLFRMGSSGKITESTGDAWREAGSVLMATRATLASKVSGAAKQEAEKKVEDVKNPGKSGVESPDKTSGLQRSNRMGVTLVSSTIHLPQGSGQETQLSTQSVNGEKNEPAKETANLSPPVVNDPFLLFWKNRDQLDSRILDGKTECFSPADFDAAGWMELQQLVIRNQRLAEIGIGDEARRDVESINLQLENLMRAIAGFTSVPESGQRSLRLITSWNAFRAAIGDRQQGIYPWVDPTVLPNVHFTKWSDSRKRIRKWIDSVYDSAKWINWTGSAEEGMDSLDPVLGEVSSGSVGVFASGRICELQGFDERRLEQARTVLIQLVNNRLERLLQRLRSSSRITWNDEREIQSLRRSLVLSFQQRLALDVLVAGCEIGRCEEPGENDYSVDMDSSHSEILGNSQNLRGDAAARNRMVRWISTLAKRLPDSTNLRAPSGEDFHILNQWGDNALSSVGPVADDFDVADWFRQVWVGTVLHSFDMGPSFSLSVIGRVSNDQRLYLDSDGSSIAIPGSVGQIHETGLYVKKGDGSIPGRCQFRWVVDNSSPLPPEEVEKSLAISIEGRPVFQGAWTDAGALTGNQLTLQVKAEVDTSRVSGFPLQLFVAANTQGDGQSIPLPLTIVPPQPNRVELVLRSPGNSPGELRPEIAMSPANNPLLDRFGQSIQLLPGLRVPALGQDAKTSHELFLYNRSGISRSVRVLVYGANATDSSLANRRGQPGEFRFEEKEDGLIFRSDVVSLPPTTGVDSLAVRVPLQKAEPGEDPVVSALYGMVFVIEEVNNVTNSSGEDAIPDWQPTGSRWEVWLPWTGTNPYWEKIVKIVPEQADGQVRLAVSAVLSEWDRYSIESLPISAWLTNSEGDSLGGEETATLSRAKPGYTFKLNGPRIDSKAFAHLSIGSYRRSVAFSSSLGLGETAEESERPFVWIDAEKIRLVSDDPAQVELKVWKEDDATLVIPNRIEVDGNGFGEEVSLRSVIIPVRLDLPQPESDGSAFGELKFRSLDETSSGITRYLEDRQLTPQWNIVDGNLVLSVIAVDHEFEVPEAATREGQFELALRASGMQIEQSRKTNLLFDKKPPSKGVIEIVERDKRLYRDQSLTIQFNPVDAESPVREVHFAIAPSGTIDDYAAKEIPLTTSKAIWVEDRQAWTQVLPAAIMTGKPTGRWRVLARTIDAAGNFQDLNTSARFEWTDAEPGK